MYQLEILKKPRSGKVVWPKPYHFCQSCLGNMQAILDIHNCNKHCTPSMQTPYGYMQISCSPASPDDAVIDTNPHKCHMHTYRMAYIINRWVSSEYTQIMCIFLFFINYIIMSADK